MAMQLCCLKGRDRRRPQGETIPFTRANGLVVPGYARTLKRHVAAVQIPEPAASQCAA